MAQSIYTSTNEMHWAMETKLKLLMRRMNIISGETKVQVVMTFGEMGMFNVIGIFVRDGRFFHVQDDEGHILIDGATINDVLSPDEIEVNINDMPKITLFRG